MTAEAFVEEIARNAPSMDHMRRIGIDGELASEFTREHMLTRFPGKQVPMPEEDPLLTLLKGFDLSHSRIGSICFAQPPKLEGDRLIIGDIDADPLVYNLLTREITFCDHECPSFVMSKVAKDGGAFLDALAIASKLFTSTLLGEIPFPTGYDAHAFPVAKRCAEAAGGDEYLDFYLMLTGVDERRL
jgi:hypothetical protein